MNEEDQNSIPVKKDKTPKHTNAFWIGLIFFGFIFATQIGLGIIAAVILVPLWLFLDLPSITELPLLVLLSSVLLSVLAIWFGVRLGTDSIVKHYVINSNNKNNIIVWTILLYVLYNFLKTLSDINSSAALVSVIIGTAIIALFLLYVLRSTVNEHIAKTSSN